MKRSETLFGADAAALGPGSAAPGAGQVSAPVAGQASAPRGGRDLLARAVHNPFSTRRVRPGAIAFRPPPGKSLADLLAQLEGQGWRGAIVGPHGSGKSTLLAAIVERLARAGREAWVVALGEGDRLSAGAIVREAARRGARLVAVDGYERLGRWSRWRLDRLCRRRGLGLVVTSHGSVRLPLLLATAPSLELAASLAASLLDAEWDAVYRRRLASSYRARAGNLREVFFDLYDLYESRRHGDAMRGDAGSALSSEIQIPSEHSPLPSRETGRE